MTPGAVVRIPVEGDGRAVAAALRAAVADSAARAIVAEIAEDFGAVAAGNPGIDRSAALADACLSLFGCPKPVIGEASGRLSGWALTAASAVDLLVVAESTMFSGNDDGTPTGCCGPWAYLLPPRIAKWLALCGGDIDAEEAFEAGFVNRLAPDDALQQTTDELAARTALVPADVLIAKKAAHIYDMETEGYRAVLASAAEFDALATATPHA